MTTLTDLPLELILNIHLLSRSPYLPLTCHHLYSIFSQAPDRYKASYLVNVCRSSRRPLDKALRYPICTSKVFSIFYIRFPICPIEIDQPPISLPRRLFRNRPPDYDILYKLVDDYGADVNSEGGYALARAAHNNDQTLIDWLLQRGARPNTNQAVAVLSAVKSGNIEIVSRLVEWKGQEVKCTTEMLNLAIRSENKSLVDYLLRHGATPNMNMLRSLDL